jgi:hypothetical protein
VPAFWVAIRGEWPSLFQNPVRRKLVLDSHERNWSSARYYLIGEKGTVSVNEKLYVEMRVRPVA